MKISRGEKIVTVPGTNIQSDEGPEFDGDSEKDRNPQCKSILEQLRIRYPEAQIRYARGCPGGGKFQGGICEALRLPGMPM